MKRLMSVLLAVLAITSVFAADRISRNVNDLPQAARTALTRHFGKAKVNFIKIDDKFLGSPEYTVVLNNGTEVDFDSKGEVTEVEAGPAGVSSSLILKPVQTYLSKNYRGAKVVELKIKKNKYELELSTGQDLEFDRAGNFLRVDD